MTKDTTSRMITFANSLDPVKVLFEIDNFEKKNKINRLILKMIKDFPACSMNDFHLLKNVVAKGWLSPNNPASFSPSLPWEIYASCFKYIYMIVKKNQFTFCSVHLSHKKSFDVFFCVFFPDY